MDQVELQVGEGFVLRELAPQDANDLKEVLQDEESKRFFMTDGKGLMNDVTGLLMRLIEEGIFFSILPAHSKTVIGLIGIKQEGTKGTARLAYMLHPRYRGRGIMPEIIKAVTGQMVKDLRIKRLEAAISPANVNSLRCIEKAGYQMCEFLEAGINPETGEEQTRKILYVYEQ